VQGSAEHRLLDALLGAWLEACKAQGLLKARRRQRTDATHVLGALRVLSRLERVAEPLRAALNALAKEAPDWLQERVPPDWYERYGRRIEEYRLPRSQADREVYGRQVGADGGWLLAQLAQPQTPPILTSLAEVGLLRQFWEQEYVRSAAGGDEWRDPKAVPAASDHLESPYEPEARFAPKREMHWTGYKVHLTPDVRRRGAPHGAPHGDPGERHQRPSYRCRPVAPHPRGPGPAPSPAGTAVRRCRLCARRQRHPTSSNVIQSRQKHQKHQIDLVGPVDTDHPGQSRVEDGFITARFQLDWDQHRATCPRGGSRIRWCEAYSTARKRTMLHREFDPVECLPCPDRARCPRSKSGSRARCLTLQSRVEYEELLAGRARQQTLEFAQLYARRAGIEGAFSQGVRAFGLRRARYRGLQKTHLQQVATAAAIDMTRLSAWLNGIPAAPTRRSRFARLAPAC
jgi:transposase